MPSSTVTRADGAAAAERPAFERPFRPRSIALLNALGRAAARVGLRTRLDPGSLVDAARRKAGLRDFGDDEWWLEPLGVLVDSLEHEARLTPMGRLIQRRRLVDALVNRLRIHALCSEHPEIHDIELERLIVIAGLQRTGTTMLHRLLASSPHARSLAAWEAINPAPFPGERPGAPSGRVRMAKRAEQGARYMSPQFFAIHPIEHEAPEEDVLLLDLCFMSQSAEATARVPSYARWLEEQDHHRAYEYLATCLRVLWWQRPARHWVLKTPHHLEYLDTLLDVLPGARIVQTHRDPQRTTPSFCSMVAHGMGIFSDEVSGREVGEHWLRKIRIVLERAMAVRAARPDAFLDVSYYDLMRDPIAELERIHAFAGVPFDDATRRAAEQTKSRNVQHKYGRHRYALADFGLSEERLEKELGFYRSHFGIPHEASMQDAADARGHETAPEPSA